MILHNLFGIQQDKAIWLDRIKEIIARTWLEIWQELVGDRREFQIPLRLLNAAVRYRETKGVSEAPTKEARRVLLELPVEERNLLQSLLEVGDNQSEFQPSKNKISGKILSFMSDPNRCLNNLVQIFSPCF
ncbi:hypothetical protein [Pseudanabaena sp. PCC 6802]|uniref:hypothetical protein n=1 Tax=Pseudanabaena sp. PCC 6802 TaxID=118173 RepID=UPI00034CC1AD|nr:hypothetical protein [Pseudanabaena sp. PCC 6802]